MKTSTTSVRVVDDPLAGDREFLAGTGSARLMWAYDLMSQAMRIGAVHDRVLELAAARPGDRMLDVGCGTGNLSLKAARAGVLVTGLDPDRRALERAAAKATHQGVDVTLVRGYADHLPVEDGSQQHVVSSFALHHVPTAQKAALAAELARVLAPGGRVTIVDMAPDASHSGRKPRAYLADNADHGIEGLLSAAGLVGTAQVDRTRRMGTDVVFVQASKP